MMVETDTILIRRLFIAELPLCERFAHEFHDEKQLGRFKIEVFIRNWTYFLNNAPAAIFGMWKNGELVGGLGAVVTPDLSDARKTATEMFWFVTKAARNGRDAWKLVEAFEAWGVEEDVDEYRIAHLLLPDEDPATVRLAPLYKRKGYRAIDVSFIKPRKKEGLPCPL